MRELWLALVDMPWQAQLLIGLCGAVVGVTLIVGGAALWSEFLVMHDEHDEQRQAWVRAQQRDFKRNR